jgi:hypothetical protein
MRSQGKGVPVQAFRRAGVQETEENAETNKTGEALYRSVPKDLKIKVGAKVKTLFLAGPFVDCSFPFWAKQLRRDFQAKEDSSDEFSLWLQALEKYFLAL